MSKLKVGDKVRVRKDLIGGQDYGNVRFQNFMRKYDGLETTISFVDYVGDYKLKDCDGCWFSEEMLEPVEEVKVEYDENLSCYFALDGKHTLCFKELGMSSTHPSDQYDEEIGKALAYKRLMEGIKHE